MKRQEPDAAPQVPQGLVYVHDGLPGIRRVRKGKGFAYVKADGTRLADAAQLERIRRLAIPPAYTQVWICPLANGHLQATGRDARGRKQFRYHASWRTARDEDKFGRMEEFGAALPRIRAQVAADLAQPVGERVPRGTVVAAIVRLLDSTLVRVGNDEYARTNGSFGLTTLRNRHAAVQGGALRLRFRGKSGVQHEVDVRDRRVARVVRRCQGLPGQQLFEYLDEAGEVRSVGSADVNDYLRAASGGAFTAKDFRTWHGSVLALRLVREHDAAQPPGEAAPPAHACTVAKSLLAQVAARLGNTVAVCRKSYVHPRVLALLAPEAPSNASSPAQPVRKAGLSLDERRFLSFLKHCH
jgi:DNA topoisomerase I